MKVFTAVIENALIHGFIGYVPKFLYAHLQGETLDESKENLKELKNVIRIM
ncbi:MAG TPA: type II toxin-antitoxin system HicB family antitoxin [Candidatus Desulfofervidus auxilii]|uniref:Type II toxin-antitoxin system HicB family antitoxin n=1 Tax=Desulfofervidus auxilii TaxID=1621989 RepID=A0A7C0Y3B5_DESA2|nr:type II toxin-antitoxin system HicB family antitoxin [Candidatus Desulfofervidus auxilii]